MKKSLLTLSLAFYSVFSTAATINVASYNVENFFDTVHDEGKDDWTYLPKKTPGKEENCRETQTAPHYLEACLETNWNDRRFKLKTENIARVIRSMNPMPDILGLVEIENENVVGAIATELGYKNFIVANSPDERGIDVAFIYKEGPNLKFVSSAEHVLKAAELTKPTRNILEANFIVSNGANSYPLLVMVNHWPSQSNPHLARVRAAELAMKIINEKVAQNPKTHVIVMGDFNVTDKDAPHAFKTTLFQGPNALWDVHGMYMKSKEITKEAKNIKPKGTYFYPANMGWDLLDRFFVTKNMTDGQGLDITLSSYDIHRPDFVTANYKYEDPQYYEFGTVVKGVPDRFDSTAFFKKTMGFSDHFAIKMQIDIK